MQTVPTTRDSSQYRGRPYRSLQVLAAASVTTTTLLPPGLGAGATGAGAGTAGGTTGGAEAGGPDPAGGAEGGADGTAQRGVGHRHQGITLHFQIFSLFTDSL